MTSLDSERNLYDGILQMNEPLGKWLLLRQPSTAFQPTMKYPLIVGLSCDKQKIKTQIQRYGIICHEKNWKIFEYDAPLIN